ncbi:hypothetical protein AMECASPLE_022067 [Ameca splendens]|uniref:Uncharacterized protein n=1 Tax=Ameca splendens TaxID=208324 RepID=A0ABV0ZPW4_9TELE
MIGDRVTLLDPVEELFLFASKETLARCACPVPVINVVEEIGSLGSLGARQRKEGTPTENTSLSDAARLIINLISSAFANIVVIRSFVFVLRI